ncbi:MAG: hypothetical protein L0H93_14300 [Nocardioides sp.]|nr:hypothetical protein [Nocardioides sp.]
MRRVLAGASLALLAVTTLSGCGGDDEKDAKDKASVSDFCEANTEAGEAKDLDALKDAVDKIDDNLLDDMSEDEKDGFGVLKKAVDDADKEEDLAAFEKDMSDDDKKKVEAYNKYGAEACADESSDAPTEDAPSEDSSE